MTLVNFRPENLTRAAAMRLQRTDLHARPFGWFSILGAFVLAEARTLVNFYCVKNWPGPGEVSTNGFTWSAFSKEKCQASQFGRRA